MTRAPRIIISCSPFSPTTGGVVVLSSNTCMWATIYQIAVTPITKTGKQINVSIHDNMEVIDLQP